jgi:hypothetical protein
MTGASLYYANLFSCPQKPQENHAGLQRPLLSSFTDCDAFTIR